MKIDAITDDHMHIDPVNGLGVEAAKRFKRAGGTCFFLVNKMSIDVGVTISDAGGFGEVFDRTISLKDIIARETGLEVFAVIGVHPAEFNRMCKVFGIEKALEIAMEATDMAGGKVSDGDATALGEMGRPHFEVDGSALEAANQLLRHGMVVAREADCAIQLHTESSSEQLFEELSTMAKKAGLKPEKV